MKLELKTIKYHHESGILSGTLYVDGIKAANVENLALHAGMPFNYRPVGIKGNDLLQQAKEYCKKLQPLIIGGISRPMDIDAFVVKSLADFTSRQYDLKREKEMERAIVYGNDDLYFSLKLPAKISEILAIPSARPILLQKIRELVLPKLKPGDKILNTNFDQAFLDELSKAKINIDQAANNAREQGKKAGRVDEDDTGQGFKTRKNR